MAKIKCVFSYDGTRFFGMQIQPQVRTVQGVFEQALSDIHKGAHVPIYPSGRTDKGVHAKAQTAHFESDYPLTPDDWKRAINSKLPPDVYIHETEETDESFHARFDAVSKEYRYYIYHAKEPDVFKQNYLYHYPYSLDVSRMQEACRYIAGTHDFTTFSSAKADIKGDRIRTIYDIFCRQDGSHIEFILRGNGFLYNMVRIIVGTLLDVGRGKLSPGDIEILFAKKDRQYGGNTLPPQGLYLWQVTYAT